MIDRGKDVRFKYFYGHPQLPGVLLNDAPVFRAVTRIHHQKAHLKGEFAVKLQLLKEFGHEHGILASRNAHGDPVPFLYQRIPANGFGKLAPQRLTKLFLQAGFRLFLQIFLLPLHLPLQPGGIASLQAESLIPLFRQHLRCLPAELPPGAVYNKLSAVMGQGTFLQRLPGHGQRAGDTTVFPALGIAYIQQHIAARLQSGKGLQGHIHRAALSHPSGRQG